MYCLAKVSETKSHHTRDRISGHYGVLITLVSFQIRKGRGLHWNCFRYSMCKAFSMIQEVNFDEKIKEFVG